MKDGIGMRATALRLVTGILLSLAAPIAAAAVAAAEVGAADFQVEMGFPYDAFDRLEDTAIVEVGGSRLTVGIVPGGEPDLPMADILAWVRQSAEDVAAYYGKFPVPAARILLVVTDGDEVRTGTTWGYRGGAIRVVVGRHVSAATLMHQDWIMVHEMIHLALPDVGERHAWLSEGIAVYVESIARVQQGRLPAARIWTDFVRAMPKGLPQAGDRGLDNTHSWGRTYWGGALFCLLADIEIRKRTGNRHGLQTALRAINARTNHTDDSDIASVLALGDEATGVPVLRELYDQMKDQPVTTDLAAIWRELGVPSAAGQPYDDSAPRADVRLAITEPAEPGRLVQP